MASEESGDNMVVTKIEGGKIWGGYSFKQVIPHLIEKTTSDRYKPFAGPEDILIHNKHGSCCLDRF